jgi:GNAT superfamily N-acetyltransferase
MRIAGWLGVFWLVFWFGGPAGCAIPPPEKLPLRVEDARRALDNWNPQYCRVEEFYGFHEPGADIRVAFVSLASPAQPDLKPVVYEARFQLLTRPDGRQQWFLTSLMNHAAGLTRRQGWDNLLIAVEPGKQ